jgi:lipoate-protein ligase A
MNRIRYLGFASLEPAINMAIDEMLFNRALGNNSSTALRFFTFNKRCISIGRNQHPENLPQEFVRKKIEIVKRPTGGGAVFHDGDLCYSMVMPESFLGKGSTLLTSYSVITRGLKNGFKLCGIDAGYGESTAVSAQPLCFNQALSYELTVNGKKLVGSAQRRAKGILLQQGSIQHEHTVSQDNLINALLEGLRSSLNIEYVYEPLTEDEIEASKAVAQH